MTNTTINETITPHLRQKFTDWLAYSKGLEPCDIDGVLNATEGDAMREAALRLLREWQEWRLE